MTIVFFMLIAAIGIIAICEEIRKGAEKISIAIEKLKPEPVTIQIEEPKKVWDHAPGVR